MEHHFEAESVRICVLHLPGCWASDCMDDYMAEDVWCSHTAVTWHLCTLVLTVPQKIDVLIHLYTLRTFILYRTQILAHKNIT